MISGSFLSFSGKGGFSGERLLHPKIFNIVQYVNTLLKNNSSQAAKQGSGANTESPSFLHRSLTHKDAD